MSSKRCGLAMGLRRSLVEAFPTPSRSQMSPPFTRWLGEPDLAFEWLDMAYRERNSRRICPGSRWIPGSIPSVPMRASRICCAA